MRRGAGAETAVEQGLGPVGDDFGGVEVVERAETMAVGAGAEGGVEGEAARFELGHVEATIGAGHRRGKQLLVAIVKGDEREAVGQLQGFVDSLFQAFLGGGLGGRLSVVVFPPFPLKSAERMGHAGFVAQGPEKDAVDDGFDGVVLSLVEREGLGKVAHLAIDAGAKSLLVKLIQ